VRQLTHRIDGAIKITEPQNGAEVRVVIGMSDSLIGVLLHRGARVVQLSEVIPQRANI
jgi:hypothetical protein